MPSDAAIEVKLCYVAVKFSADISALSFSISADEQPPIALELSTLQETEWSGTDHWSPTFKVFEPSRLSVVIHGEHDFLDCIPHVSSETVLGKASISPFDLIIEERLDGQQTPSFPILDDYESEVGTIQICLRLVSWPQWTPTVDLPLTKERMAEELGDASAMTFMKVLGCLNNIHTAFYVEFQDPVEEPDRLKLALGLLSKLYRYHLIPVPFTRRARLVTALKSRLPPIEACNIVLDDCPAEDIILQMKDLLLQILHARLRIIEFQIDIHPFLDSVLSEVCSCALFLDGLKEKHSDITYKRAEMENILDTYTEHQRLLFGLRTKLTLIVHDREHYDKVYSRQELVMMLLNYSVDHHELQDQQEEPDAGRPPRPFLGALTSPRGVEADRVSYILNDILQQEHDVARRNMYRRAMTRLIQRADKLPKFFYVRLDSPVKPKPIGQGGFSRVYEGRHKGAVVAVKIPDDLSRVYTDPDSRKRTYREIVTWKTVHHPFVLEFRGLAALSETIGIGSLAMISPFMSNGTLEKARIDSTTELIDGGRPVYHGVGAHRVKVYQVDEEKALRYLKEIAEGMVFLHNEGVVHGDLRGPNVFISKDDHVKIADFGLCVYSEGFSKGYFSTRSGNVRWTAPEMIAPELYNGGDQPAVVALNDDGVVRTGRPTRKSDVYSFGCLCVEIHCLDGLFNGRTDSQIIYAVLRPKCERPKRPRDMQEKLWKVVEQCWSDDAGQRPTFAEVYEMLKAS